MENEIYNDDEPILRLNSKGGKEGGDIEIDGGRTEVNIFNKVDAPLEECPFKVLVELKGKGADKGRLGVDLVTVLDISSSMKGYRLDKMKLAMKFLVQKLSRDDRLSVVTFSRYAKKLCSLRQITENSKTEIETQINDLKTTDSTNPEAGLKMAIKVLDDRTHFKNRSKAIMLMTDGMEDANRSNIRSVPVGEVPVYTFAFGNNGCDHHEELSDIAKKSKGGTFSPVQELDDLNVAFSTALAGLLNVSTEDLSMTVTPLNGSQLNKVNAGKYPQTQQVTVMDPVTVTFGSLYDGETRKVLALLTLPKVDKRFGVNIFHVEFKYRVSGKDKTESEGRFINVTRKPASKPEEVPEVLAEETRIRTASSIKEARILADTKNLEKARKNLVDAANSLTETDDILKAQVEHFRTLLASQEIYDSKGKAFALALEASHESQRSIALPGHVPSMYDTPLMAAYKRQAYHYDSDQNYRVPTAEEDKIAIARAY